VFFSFEVDHPSETKEIDFSESDPLREVIIWLKVIMLDSLLYILKNQDIESLLIIKKAIYFFSFHLLSLF
jgi:hypothetical protein